MLGTKRKKPIYGFESNEIWIKKYKVEILIRNYLRPFLGNKKGEGVFYSKRYIQSTLNGYIYRNIPISVGTSLNISEN